jgi:hypothetical protein
VLFRKPANTDEASAPSQAKTKDVLPDTQTFVSAHIRVCKKIELRSSRVPVTGRTDGSPSLELSLILTTLDIAALFRALK